jgi:hypothetical protein
MKLSLHYRYSLIKGQNGATNVILTSHQVSSSYKFYYNNHKHPAMIAQWLERLARNHKVPGSRPATAMSSLGDWFTQP